MQDVSEGAEVSEIIQPRAVEAEVRPHDSLQPLMGAEGRRWSLLSGDSDRAQGNGVEMLHLQVDLT